MTVRSLAAAGALFVAGCASSPATMDRSPMAHAPDWLGEPVAAVVEVMGEPTAVLGTRYIWERYREQYLDATGHLVCDDRNTCVLSDRGAVANWMRRGVNYRCAVVVEIEPQSEQVTRVQFKNSDDEKCERVWMNQ